MAIYFYLYIYIYIFDALALLLVNLPIHYIIFIYLHGCSEIISHNKTFYLRKWKRI
jgi:hypothetical protein